MARLMEAYRTLDLEAEVDLGGRWVELRGERRSVYVFEDRSPSGGYYTWCGAPGDRTRPFHRDVTGAIRAGCAAQPGGRWPTLST